MDMVNKVLEISRDIFKDETLQLESQLKDAKEFDSMALVQYVLELESTFDVILDVETFKNTFTVIDVITMIKERK